MFNSPAPSQPLSGTAQGAQRFYPLYLIYSLFYFFPLIFMGSTLTAVSDLWWLGYISVYVTFIALFFVIVKVSGACRVVALLLMLLLSLAGTNISVGTSALFAYAAFYSVLLFEGRQRIICLSLTFLSITVAIWATEFVWYFWGPALIPSALNSVMAYVELQKQALQKQTQKTIFLAERERIANDLHDVTGHQLTAISLKAQLAKKCIDNQHYDKATQELTAIAELAATNRAAIRSAIEGELPKDLTLVSRDLIALLHSQGFNCCVVGTAPKIIDQAAADVAAIYSEAMTNILRHGQPADVSIEHMYDDQGYTLLMKNKVACGNPEFKTSISTKQGLNSLSQRAKGLGGSMHFVIDQSGLAVLSVKLPKNIITCE